MRFHIFFDQLQSLFDFKFWFCITRHEFADISSKHLLIIHINRLSLSYIYSDSLSGSDSFVIDIAYKIIYLGVFFI